MNILFINTSLECGGAEKMLSWLANRFAAKSDKVTFLTYRSDEEDYWKLDERINRICLKTECGKKGIIQKLKTVSEIRKTIKSGKYQVLVAFNSPSQFRAVLSTVGLKTRLVFSQRGDPYQPISGNMLYAKLVGWVCDAIFSFADALVFQTDMAKEYYGKKIRSKGFVIPNPVVKKQSAFHRNDSLIENRIVAVSRLDNNQKRIDLLIDAFNAVSEQNDSIVLEIYGDGPDRSFLEKKAEKNNRIVFKGYTEKVEECIYNARLFVITSDFEGIPNALIEAMSYGLPCVSTDCSPGGAAMLIKNRENGILVERGNVTQIAQAICYMLSNPKEAEKMGERAKDIVSEYSEEVIFNKWSEILS